MAIVLEQDAARFLAPATSLRSLNADSLVLVSVADVIEDVLVDGWATRIHLDDATLGRADTIADLVSATEALLT